jgi:[ribosomal protein S5]-alanine N-acetyltransferase
MRELSKCLPLSFETKRLLVRKVVLEDARIFYNLFMQDVDVAKYMTWKVSSDINNAIKYVNRTFERFENQEEITYTICKKSDNSIIGVLACRPKESRLEFGYLLGKAYWNNGFMQEVVEKIVDIAFSYDWCWRAQASCHVDNLGSRRTLEKAGFICEGLMKKYIIHPNIDLIPTDSYLYAKVKAEK